MVKVLKCIASDSDGLSALKEALNKRIKGLFRKFRQKV